MFTQLAFAMGGAAGGGEGGGGGLTALMPLVIMFVIFYFLLIRPQQKKQKQHRELLSNLRKGDKVVTSGGLYGTITGVSDIEVTLEIAPKVRVKVARSFVSGLAGSAAPAPQAEEKK